MADRFFAATRKGLFTFTRDRAGKWTIAERAFLGDPVSMVLPDPRDGTLYAALWLGHFGLTQESATPLFRHTIPLRGAPGVSVEQLEDLVDVALNECERFYPALQLVVWGGRSVGDAIAAAHMDTVGEA